MIKNLISNTKLDIVTKCDHVSSLQISLPKKNDRVTKRKFSNSIHRAINKAKL